MDDGEDEDARQEREAAEARERALKAIPVPTCCQAAQTQPVVWLSLEDPGNKPSDTAGARWRAKVNRDLAFRGGDRWVHPEVKFCPHCGENLPEMVRKKSPPEPLCRFSDGGYYCDTCKERLNCCVCLPPEAAFEPKT
jgi:hypothetical protein